ncbi:hypothetical protein MX629_00200 [Carnobacterium divergens]|uniref:Flagellar FliJ protein n=1 Tax=Carnobacterium divergens TaxID=2748 RepID=A0AAW8R580_CARDV|nr:hypothetical protein [Carnobacterium divergens]MDT1956840.1 hypothetical protein [Carnobacterium divergens]MDT1972810.1 hypothetical protein [Carnobacterium divergens]
MEKEEELSKKLDVLETDYRKEKQQIEETIEAVHHENRVFRREIESLADYVRYTAKREEATEPEALQQTYRFIQEAQEEGQMVVKKTLNKLDDEKEEQRLTYQKQRMSYEEDVLLERKERNS